jgi:hypothetical protein
MSSRAPFARPGPPFTFHARPLTLFCMSRAFLLDLDGVLGDQCLPVATLARHLPPQPASP